MPTPAPRRRSQNAWSPCARTKLSIYDISAVLADEGQRLSPAAVSLILRRRASPGCPGAAMRSGPAGVRPDPAAVADVRELDLSPRQFRTQFGGLFLFVPYLAAIPFDRLLQQAGFPGSRMVRGPGRHARVLGLKLFGSARHSHVMSSVFDQGLALFAGLNVIPKRAFLTEYSCRDRRRPATRTDALWFDAVGKLGLERGVSFDLDFHTIPFHGEEALVEKHYVSKRSRRQKGILAFLAQDADHARLLLRQRRRAQEDHRTTKSCASSSSGSSAPDGCPRN